MSQLFENNRIQTTRDAVINSLVSTRSEAISRNQNVVMCKSQNGTACDASNNWEDGWLVFSDTDGDGTLDTGEPVLLVQNAFANGATVRTGNNYGASLTYLADGSVNLDDTFTVCGRKARDDDAMQVIVTATGRPRGSEGGACP